MNRSNRFESPRAALERQFVTNLVRAIAGSRTDDERQRHVSALADLVGQLDPSLDTSLFDPWTRAYLGHLGLPMSSPSPLPRGPRITAN